MTNTESLNRALTLSVTGVISVLMFGLAYTASASMLYPQLELGMKGSDNESIVWPSIFKTNQ